jgi:nucleotide-binding universal stress UspA family protein
LAESRILVAVSTPWASRKLAEALADLGRRLRAEVLVAHVAQQREEDEHESEARQRGEQTLEMFVGALQEQEVTAESVMLFSDDPSKAIVKTARERACSLIVLGLTRKGLLRRMLTADVPGKVLASSDLPVLMCPVDWSGVL